MVSLKIALALLGALHCCLAGQLHIQAHGDVVPGEYIAVFKSEAQREVEETINGLPGITVKRSFNIGKHSFLTVSANPDAAGKLAALDSIDFVESNQITYAEESQEQSSIRGKRPGPQVQASNNDHPTCNRDPLNGEESWGLIRSVHKSTPKYERDAYTWGDSDDGEGVDIYVLDTGIDVNHPDFGGRATWGYTASSLQGGKEEDVSGHGTHIAGVAGGAYYGVARKSTLIAVQVLNERAGGKWSDIADGIAYVVSRVQELRKQGKGKRSVINMSISGKANGYAIMTALEAANDLGILSVVAAGNSGDDACLYFPARISSAMTVASSTITDKLSVTSNHGPCVDIIAPGSSIMGPQSGTNLYFTKSGTAFAAPLVTGMVARYLSSLSDHEASEITPYMTKAALLSQASQDQIDLTSNITEALLTPNRLLYKTCDLPASTPTNESMCGQFRIWKIVAVCLGCAILGALAMHLVSVIIKKKRSIPDTVQLQGIANPSPVICVGNEDIIKKDLNL